MKTSIHFRSMNTFLLFLFSWSLFAVQAQNQDQLAEMTPENIASLTQLATFESDPANSFDDLVWLSNGDEFVTISQYETALIYSFQNIDTPTSEFDVGPGASGLRVGPNDTILVTHRITQQGHLFELGSDLPILSFAVEQGQLNGDFSLSLDGQYLAGKVDKALQLHSAETGELLMTIEYPSAPEQALPGVNTFAFTPDSQSIAVTGIGDGMIRLFDVNNGEEIAQYEVLTDDPERVAKALTELVFSPDGEMLAAASLSDEVYLWDVETGEQLHTLKGGYIKVHLAFAPNGTLLFSSSEAIFTVWDVATGAPVYDAQLGYFFGGISALAVSPNGKLLAVLDRQGISLWGVPLQ
jgi:WD40 repeat protein